MTLGSLFDGIGGWLLAARHAGVTPVWASEIELFPCSVTARHFPDVKQLGDITQIDPDTLTPVDIICAGSPCQDLSIAGKRKGLDGERSGLFRTAVDLVRRMRERTAGKYPRFFVWENVPGAFSSNRGMDFQAVLEEIGESEIPMPQGNRWAPAGLVQFPGTEIAWRVLDAQYWGVPQRRRRIFLVADFAAHDRCAGEILFEHEGVPWNPQESKGAREGSTRGAENCARTSGAITSWDVQSRRIYDENGTMAALYSGDGQGTHNGAVLIRAAGFIGKAAPSAGNIGYTRECAPTLIAGKEQHVAIYDIQHRDDVIRPVKDGKIPTLTARMGTGGHNVPIAHIYGAKSFSEYEKGRVATLRAAGGNYGGGSENIALCVGNGQADNARLQEKVGALNCMHDQQIILTSTTIRRLTPTECERLQGLDDGYTEGGSDTARYKALGNGMAQPCADYVIRRIVEETKEA